MSRATPILGGGVVLLQACYAITLCKKSSFFVSKIYVMGFLALVFMELLGKVAGRSDTITASFLVLHA